MRRAGRAFRFWPGRIGIRVLTRRLNRQQLGMSNKRPAKKKVAKGKVAKKRVAKKRVAKKRVAKVTAAKKAKRYTDDVKKQVLDFVESIGRGGISQAAKKFGVSPLSISNWKKKLGGGESATKSRSEAKPSGRDQVLAKMTKLSSEMVSTEKKLAAMQKEFDQLKAML